jgi:hypothetical protein
MTYYVLFLFCVLQIGFFCTNLFPHNRSITLVNGAFTDAEAEAEVHTSSHETWDSEDYYDTQYTTTNTHNKYRSLQASSDTPKPTVLDRLRGIAITLAILLLSMAVTMLLSYLSAICLDQYGNLCCQTGPPPLTAEEWAIRHAADQLTVQAGLAGITAEERFRILEYFFQNKTVHDYDHHHHQVEEEDDNEHGTKKETSNPTKEKVIPSTALASTADVRPATAAPKTTLEISQGDDTIVTEDMTLSPLNKATTTTTTTTTTVAAAGAEASIDNQDDDVELQELCTMEHTEGSCPICLAEYQTGEKVMTGTQCNHVFHYSCAMQWMNRKDKPNCHCPFCRKDMLTPMEFHQAAQLVLGEERTKVLIQRDILAVTMMRQAAMYGTTVPGSPPIPPVVSSTTTTILATISDTTRNNNDDVVVVVPSNHQRTESSTPPSVVVPTAAATATLTTANAPAKSRTLSDTPAVVADTEEKQSVLAAHEPTIDRVETLCVDDASQQETAAVKEEINATWEEAEA